MYHFPEKAVIEFTDSLSKKLKGDLFSNIATKQTEVIKTKIPGLLNTGYIKNVILPLFQTTMASGERLDLPMLDTVNMNKQNALPYYLWGLLYDSYKPPATNKEKKDLGTTVFLTGYDSRGADNLRKKIYISALTKNLYAPMYQEKVKSFFDFLLGKENANKPLMNIYLDSFASLYWDLHVDVKDDIPKGVKDIARAFNTVLA
ncbi:MAG: hypothetical protein KJN84_12550, partial [Bacteroidia bacterium]|nr:hypothetical protein [Bacteroidia bacterium]